MSTEFADQRFVGVRLHHSITERPPIRFERCAFDGCSVAVRSNDHERLTVDRVSLVDCEVRGGGVRGVTLRNVLVHGLNVRSLPQILGCVLEHVVLRGRINQLMIRGDLPTVTDPESFESAARAAYREIDWALDISELDCPDLDIRGLPLRLVRLDPGVHAIVERAEADAGRWRSINLEGTGFDVSLARMLRDEADEVLLVAPRRGAGSARASDALGELRAAGVAS
jgi:hypothetical protein